MAFPIGVDCSSFDVLTENQLSLYSTSADFYINRIGIVYYRRGWSLDKTAIPRLKFLKQLRPDMVLGAYFLPHGQILRGLGDPLTLDISKHPYMRSLYDALNQVNLDYLFCDIEEHTVTESNEAEARTATLDFLVKIADGMRKGYIPPMKIGIYSRATWVKSFPSISKLIEQDANLHIWSATWARGNIMWLDSIQSLRTLRPSISPIVFGQNPNRKKPVTLHQFAGDSGLQYRFRDFSIGKSVDINVFMGTLDELYPRTPEKTALGELDEFIERIFEAVSAIKTDELRSKYTQIRRKLGN